MRPKYFFKSAIALAVLLAAFFLSSYLKKNSVPSIPEQCAGKVDSKSSEEGAIKGDLFFWESITRNFASIR